LGLEGGIFLCPLKEMEQHRNFWKKQERYWKGKANKGLDE